MTLRHRGHEPTALSEGCVVISSHTVPVVRFELSDLSVSYVNAELRQWDYAVLETNERVRIRAGADLITIAGTHLLPVRNALDQLRLQVVRELRVRVPAPHTRPWVQQIVIERSKPASK